MFLTTNCRGKIMQLPEDPEELKQFLTRLVEISEATLAVLTSPVIVFNIQEEFWRKDCTMYGHNMTGQNYVPPPNRFAKFTDYINANIDKGTLNTNER